MFWLFAVFAGAFLSACSNFVDKYLLEKKIKDPLSMVSYMGIVAVTTVSVLWGIVGTDMLSISLSFPLILSGIFILCAMMVYFSLLKQDHVSFVVVFFQLIPILIVIQGMIFFGERLSLIQLLGMFLVITSAIALSWIDHVSETFRWTLTRESLIKVLAFDFLWALSVLCIKVASNNATFPQIIMYEQIGILIGVVVLLLLSPPLRLSIFAMIHSTSLSTKATALMNEGLLVFLSKVCYNYAYSYGKISIASIGESSHVLFVVVMGALLTFVNPKVFKENVKIVVVVRKVMYVIFMLLGIYLIV